MAKITFIKHKDGTEMVFECNWPLWSKNPARPARRPASPPPAPAPRLTPEQVGA